MYYIARNDDLPDWLVYPPLFHKMVEQGLVNLCPWHITPVKDLRRWLYHLGELYPERRLYPFAFKQDTSDLACWEAGRGELVFVVQDVTEHDSPAQTELPNMEAWLAMAIEDMIFWQ
jgi:hypothetical protein